jgi:hypothetical protein
MHGSRLGVVDSEMQNIFLTTLGRILSTLSHHPEQAPVSLIKRRVAGVVDELQEKPKELGQKSATIDHDMMNTCRLLLRRSIGIASSGTEISSLNLTMHEALGLGSLTRRRH